MILRPLFLISVCLVIQLEADEYITSIGKKELVIGGIFPMSAAHGGWAGGQACQPAANMALQDVNLRKDILKNYILKMDEMDSQCEPGKGAESMYKLLYDQPERVKIMILSGCSLVTTIVAEAAPLWNLVVVAYGASSPALSDRSRFPSMFRTHPSATIHNPTRLALFEKYHWEKIAILSSVEELFQSTAKDLERMIEKDKNHKLNLVARQSFSNNPVGAIKSLKRQDARIIVGLFYESEARKVFCEVLKEGMYGRRYVWFLIGWYSDNWYIPVADENLNCTKEQMEEAVQYHFTTEAMMWSNDENRQGVANLTVKRFRERLHKQLKKSPAETKGYPESPLAYDAVWAIALALNCTESILKEKSLKLEDFVYDKNIVFDDLKQCMEKTHFYGVSGQVEFSKLGDRIAWTQIEQMQDGKYEVIGYYDYLSLNMTLYEEKVKWIGNIPPQDATLKRTKIMGVSYLMTYSFYALSALAIIFALFCLGFNFWFRMRRHIYESQPLCNNIFLLGCIICNIAVFLMALDGHSVHETAYFMLCQGRLWCLMYGFSLSYGSMFAKVFTAHRMSAKESRAKDPTDSKNKEEEERAARADSSPASGGFAQFMANPGAFLTPALSMAMQRKKEITKTVKQWSLWTFVLVLCAVDTLIIILWGAIDPLQRTEEQFPDLPQPETSNEDILIQPRLEHCDSENESIWIGIVFGFKGLQLLFGMFLAYDTRSVKLKYINDTRFVGMAIYNVVILSAITAPVTLIILSQADASFGFVAATIILCTSFSMGLVFVPKFLYCYRVPTNADLRKQSDVGVSKEDEDRYKLLLAENEDIKKHIAEKEVRIVELRRRLESRLAFNKAKEAEAEKEKEAAEKKTPSGSEQPTTVSLHNSAQDNTEPSPSTSQIQTSAEDAVLVSLDTGEAGASSNKDSDSCEQSGVSQKQDSGSGSHAVPVTGDLISLDKTVSIASSHSVILQAPAVIESAATSSDGGTSKEIGKNTNGNGNKGVTFSKDVKSENGTRMMSLLCSNNGERNTVDSEDSGFKSLGRSGSSEPATFYTPLLMDLVDRVDPGDPNGAGPMAQTDGSKSSSDGLKDNLERNLRDFSESVKDERGGNLVKRRDIGGSTNGSKLSSGELYSGPNSGYEGGRQKGKECFVGAMDHDYQSDPLSPDSDTTGSTGQKKSESEVLL